MHNTTQNKTVQEKSVEICSRLNALQGSLQLKVPELAKRLEISESMLFQVKSGRRNLSIRGLYRLQELERQAGIEPPENEASVPVTKAFPPHDPTGIPVSKRRQIIQAIAALEEAIQTLKSVVSEKP